MPDRTLPGSDYDIDDRAYGFIWQMTELFHSRLKGRAIELQLEDDHSQSYDVQLNSKHVYAALKHINQDIHERILRESRLKRMVDGISGNFGSGLVGASLGLVIMEDAVSVTPGLIFVLGLLFLAYQYK